MNRVAHLCCLLLLTAASHLSAEEAPVRYYPAADVTAAFA